MTDTSTFIATAHTSYIDATVRALEWMLSRDSSGVPWLNTKFNALERREYTSADKLRGPDYRYGWIQGRGLEALILHARYLKERNPALAQQLLSRSRNLYEALGRIFELKGYASFCYDQANIPVCTTPALGTQPQHRDEGLATYSDLFAVKGFIAASVHHAPERLDKHLEQLRYIINAIRDDRFLMNESGHITNECLAGQKADFGPRMIALGAASLLHKLDLKTYDDFSHEFLNHVVTHHMDNDTGLIANTPGGHVSNVGHSIELVGFYLETHGSNIEPDQLQLLSRILSQSFTTGFNGHGVCLTADVNTQKRLSTLCPWWSLPETIRAASLAFELTNSEHYLSLWKQAHNAFLENFWQHDIPIAYQMLDESVPTDRVPATPDLDPCYHTGLSLLSALEVTDRYVTNA